MNKFRQTGTVNNLSHHRTHTALTLETLAMVYTLTKTPNKSLRRVAKEQNVSYGTAHHATHALQLHLYRIRVTHKLLPLDPDQCLHDHNWLFTNFMPVPTQPTILNNMVFAVQVRKQLK